MNRILPALSLLFVCLAACCGPRTVELTPSPHDLFFGELADRWDEAMPLGNGEVGALVWRRGTALRMSLDRVDLWDLRPMPNFHGDVKGYGWIFENWKNNTYDRVHDAYDRPYGSNPAPTKIPAGALEFDLSGWGEVDSVRLFVRNAQCKVWWNDGRTMESFVHATEPFGWFRFRGVDSLSANLLPPAYEPGDGPTETMEAQAFLTLASLGYTQGPVTRTGNTITYEQEGWNGFRYAISVTWQPVEDGIEGVWSIRSNFEGGDSDATEVQVETALATGFDAAARSHQSWWDNFWGKSALSVPEAVLEKQWYLEQYKFGSTARAYTPPISLQAVWTADNGMLPPWKGDFHHDLNTQLSYWPAYVGNHLDEEAGFTAWLWKYRDTFARYARTFFGVGGINVPGVSTLDGEPMGGWIQYSGSPTVGAWLAQHFYLRWQFTRDRVFLEERAYPWFAGTAEFLEQLSVLDADGVRILPLSSSPEINDNRRDAWFPIMTNYDLALVRFAFDKAAELARELGRETEAEHWDAVGAQWGDYSVDDHGLMFVATKSYDESHRHFSHQMAFHPLGLLDVSQSESTRDILVRTVDRLEEIGPAIWTGYSYGWMGGLCARIGDGERAARYLRDFAECFCLRNSFHANGDQTRSGKSQLTYRPFTLEGNMSFASSLQEMLLQSHTGVVNIFPAIPAEWQDVSFTTLRTEGAFLVSAAMRSGAVTEVTVTSTVGGLLRLRNPFTHDLALDDATAAPGAILEVNTAPGQTIRLK